MARGLKFSHMQKAGFLTTRFKFELLHDWAQIRLEHPTGTWEDPEGGRGSGPPLIFHYMGLEMAILCRTHLGLKLDPHPEKIFWIRACGIRHFQLSPSLNPILIMVKR